MDIKRMGRSRLLLLLEFGCARYSCHNVRGQVLEPYIVWIGRK